MREICWDVETTGLSAESDRIVEIGGVELIDLIPTGRTFHTYVNPQREVPEVVVKIHGLTYEFLKKHPTFKRVAQKFIDFVGDAQMVAHNAPFDTKFIQAELTRNGFPTLTNRMVDTIDIAKRVKPGGSMKLDALARHYGVDITKRTKHGALLDSEILAEVYLHLNGGRQFGIPLAVKEEVIEAVPGQYGERRFISRISEEESTAHTAFIEKLGLKALWRQYWPTGSI